MKIKSFSITFILTAGLFSSAFCKLQVSQVNHKNAVGLSVKGSSTVLALTIKREAGAIHFELEQQKPSKSDKSHSPTPTKKDSKISAPESKVLELAGEISSVKSEPKSLDDIETLKQKVLELERKHNDESISKSWFDGITFQIDIFSILISFILFLFFFFTLLKIIARQRERNQEENKQFLDGWAKQKQDELQTIYQTLVQLQNKIQQLESRLKEIQFSPSWVIVRSQNSSYEQNISSSPSIPHQQEVFYLSIPNSDGSFNRSSASQEYKEGASVYRFTQTSYNRATFQIDERESSIKLALSYYYKVIEPVCDAENAYNTNVRRIKTLSQGEAELQGEKWVVTRKTKIRYEY